VKRITLGSLFDGSGGFPLAGALNGIIPVWASEIEPYPLRVTAARFPSMAQLGDVTQIDGSKIAAVDIVTFGSPCQDLSIAGKQEGIHKGTRSSLFFEAIRIIREMRERDKAAGRAARDVRPRFAVWENVPGAFSSGGGSDFRAVLENIARVAANGISIPRPPRGEWDNAGCVVSDEWSIAWRVYDAQHWGVPQRRRRIYLVADFGSERAGEILFERESLCGNFEASEKERQGTPADIEGGAGGGGDSVAIYDARGNGNGDTAPTLIGDHPRRVSDYTALCVGNGQLNQMSMAEQANTLDCMHDQQAVITNGKPPRKYIVRRLTPLECCRLQGFPDWWEDDVEGSDTARYKMWGNGIALPCAADVLRRIAKEVRANERATDSF